MSELDETYRQSPDAGSAARAADPDAARDIHGADSFGADPVVSGSVLSEPVASGSGLELEVVGIGSDADLLAVPPRADDLAQELAAKPPRPKIPKLTAALCGAVLICVGFIGGALVQKNYGGGSGGGGRASSSFASAFASAAAARGGSGRSGFGFGSGTNGFSGGSSGRGAAGGSISGTVTVVADGTLYVTAPNGSVYTVKTTGSTTVSVAKSGLLSDLQPGESVTISGTSDGSGDVTATSITAGAPGSSSASGTTNATGGQ